eukprot:scaffold79273_cov17-Prasinocladus_malaysianus.AAC.1
MVNGLSTVAKSMYENVMATVVLNVAILGNKDRWSSRLHPLPCDNANEEHRAYLHLPACSPFH